MWLPIIEGSVGSTTFSRNAGGNYIKNKEIPTNPDTIRQNTMRNFLTIAAQLWRGLTQLQRDQWNAATINFPYTSIVGEIKYLSGETLFVKLNVALLNVSQPTISIPPLPQSIINFTTLGGAMSFGGGTFTLTFTPTPTPTGVGVAQSSVVYATPGISPGITNFSKYLAQIGVLAAASASPANIAGLYTAKYGSIPAIGSKVGLAIQPTKNNSGLQGSLLKSFLIVGA
jgi:hypothetical protein